METPEQKLPDQIFKMIAIGDSAVGKTCLLLLFTDNKFRPGLDPTIGCESSSRIVTAIDGDGDDDTRTKIKIVDTSGREEFRRVTRSYCDEAAAAVLVYDVTGRETLDHVGGWLKEATELAPPGLTVVLVGNKCDAPPQERAVGYEEGRGFAEEHRLVFLEASAKTNHNVDEVLFMAAKIVSRKIQDESSIYLQSLVV